MKLTLEIQKEDIQKLQKFYSSYKDIPLVKERQIKNISRIGLDPSKENFWATSIGCLLTTQQNSSEFSPISKFINQSPNPFSLLACSSINELDKFIEQKLTNFGGIRRAKKIGAEVLYNYNYLRSTNWLLVEDIKINLSSNNDRKIERTYALEVANKLKGFGPKQSRNLLQQLGLTIYEIPLDSRLIKWFNNFGFPLTLSSTALQDNNYYNFVLDGIQKLCDEAEIKPCLLDAAIFRSSEK